MADDATARELSDKIEIYKIFVATAEHHVERRIKINQFYLSAATAIFIAYAYLAEGNASLSGGKANDIAVSFARAIVVNMPLWVLPLVLSLISLSWYSTLLSFRALSYAKYRVILSIEESLPLRPFTNEWSEYKNRRKIEITQLEFALPILFNLAGVAGIFAPFIWGTRL